jgi:DNA polymerase-3 subunit gamma/tau
LKDISQHLSKIAQKETIKFEQEALDTIALKADGGLRDALSMFDLIVTFSSDNHITYQNTIKNLHILDYDYYFKVTEALLAENVADTLMIFDEILKNGFDGHNFIVGLGEHFRNLMVCKDAVTVKLLQVSDNIEKKYLEQASKATVSFLMTALNIANQNDMQYKSSKNQRLHVEMALMKMAHINAALNLSKTLIATSEELKKKVIA